MTQHRSLKEVAGGAFALPEGPVFDAAGDLYIVEVAGGRVAHVDVASGAARTLAHTGGGPNGLTLTPAGALCVANNGGLAWGEVAERGIPHRYGRIERIQPDGSVTELTREADGEPLLGPNDIVSDDHGGLWFTDPGGPNNDLLSPRGRVCYRAPDGSFVRVAAAGYQYPNGLALRHDDTELIVAETGSRTLWVHDIGGPGVLSERRPLAKLPDPHLPDGMCIDDGGSILVAGVQGSGVVVFDAAGGQLDRIPTPDAWITNIAFSPVEPVVYLTLGRTDGYVMALPWDRRGLALPGWRATVT